MFIMVVLYIVVAFWVWGYVMLSAVWTCLVSVFMIRCGILLMYSVWTSSPGLASHLMLWLSVFCVAVDSILCFAYAIICGTWDMLKVCFLFSGSIGIIPSSLVLCLFCFCVCSVLWSGWFHGHILFVGSCVFFVVLFLMSGVLFVLFGLMCSWFVFGGFNCVVLSFIAHLVFLCLLCGIGVVVVVMSDVLFRGRCLFGCGVGSVAGAWFIVFLVSCSQLFCFFSGSLL